MQPLAWQSRSAWRHRRSPGRPGPLAATTSTSPGTERRGARACSTQVLQSREFNGNPIKAKDFSQVVLYANKMQLTLMNRLYDYTVILRPEDNGTFVAYVPAIPGCHAWGQTPEEAQAELMNVFEMIEEEYKEEGRMLQAVGHN